MNSFSKWMAFGFSATSLAVATPAAAGDADAFLLGGLPAPTPLAMLNPVMTVGVLAAAPYSFYSRYPAPYPYLYARNGCLVNAAVFDDWGGFRGYQRLRVAC
jgi:hypothetical protein